MQRKRCPTVVAQNTGRFTPHSSRSRRRGTGTLRRWFATCRTVERRSSRSSMERRSTSTHGWNAVRFRLRKPVRSSRRSDVATCSGDIMTRAAISCSTPKKDRLTRSPQRLATTSKIASHTRTSARLTIARLYAHHVAISAIAGTKQNPPSGLVRANSLLRNVPRSVPRTADPLPRRGNAPFRSNASMLNQTRFGRTLPTDVRVARSSREDGVDTRPLFGMNGIDIRRRAALR